MVKEKILITIDQDLMWEHYQWYKKQGRVRTYPFCSRITEKLWLDKSKTKPKMTASGKSQAQKTRSRKLDEISIKDMKYSVLSLNDLLPIDSLAYKSKKEKWGQLGVWISSYYNLDNKNFTNAMIEMVVYSATKANKDVDNIVGGSKLLNDGLYVTSGMFKDDNYNYINPILTSCDYDKEHPRLEIRITVFEDELKNCYEKTKLHSDIWKKQNKTK